MNTGEFRFLTVGWSRTLVERLWSGIDPDRPIRSSHLLHPRFLPGCWPRPPSAAGVHFFRHDGEDPPMPVPDRHLLASLEGEGVPTVHNMILGDRVVSRLPYGEALAYATFLARRIAETYETVKPDAVISGFDALHAGISMGVARRMGIPWFVLNFSVIPSGLACFCDRLSPAARVALEPAPERHALRELARSALDGFLASDLRAPAYVTPGPRSIAASLGRIPSRVATAVRILNEGSRRDFLRYTDEPTRYSLAAAVARVRHSARSHRIARSLEAINEPPAEPFVLFGLHRQPEASTDVWAPFFSNQISVVELLARSIPPTHRLLVKIHKSDAARYSQEQFDRMRSYPGVTLVQAFADTRKFIERAGLVVAIQGTMGLEAALLGKPVIMLGESPVTILPGATRIGPVTELPALIRRKLGESPPGRSEIVEAYADFLAPFRPASHNDWNVPGDRDEAARFADLFEALRRHLAGQSAIRASATRA